MFQQRRSLVLVPMEIQTLHAFVFLHCIDGLCLVVDKFARWWIDNVMRLAVFFLFLCLCRSTSQGSNVRKRAWRAGSLIDEIVIIIITQIEINYYPLK